MDYAAATPMLPEAIEEMKRFWRQDFYNAGAIYKKAVRVRDSLESYRTGIARILGVGAKDVIFTSGGTESDNLALLGVFEASEKKNPHIIVSALEHPAILEAANEIRRRGGEVSFVSPNDEGLISPEEVMSLVRENTVLISVALANGEIGTVQPVARIGRLLKKFRTFGESSPYLHTDASQAALTQDIRMESLHADLLTLDAGKIYGPKGVGALIVRPGVSIRPQILGGGQERGLRSGTVNVALVAGFSKALEIISAERVREAERLRSLKGSFLSRVREEFPGAVINSSSKESLPNIVSLSFPGELAEFIAIKLEEKGVMVSTGSACAALKDDPGNAGVRALGKVGLEESTLRFSFGRETSERDIDAALEALKSSVI